MQSATGAPYGVGHGNQRAHTARAKYAIMPPSCGLSCAGSKRVTSGSKIKSLSTVLGLGRVPPPGPGGRTASHMPLAVIVDDRVEVRSCGPVRFLP